MAPMNQEYDFVIVGGGTAGLVVAARLSENADVSVLVLESGGDALADPRVAIPAMWSAVLGTELDWDFITVPQENLNSRQIGHPQGRALGGSSAINAEVFVPPSATGFDTWESLGNPGWGWSNVEPYFRKSHTLNPPDEALAKHLDIDWIDEATRGSNGPIQATFTGFTEDPLGRAWNTTFRQLGFGVTQDPYSGRGIGAWSTPASIDPLTKTRSYAASAYLAPVRDRPNLHVVTGATVCRILLQETSAKGVVFKLKDDNGTNEHQVQAGREVILAAGAYQSPKLLELSGIGNKLMLDKFGIATKVENNNVGQNLQDHLMTGISFEAADGVMTGISFEAADGVMTGDCLLRQEPEFVNAFMQMYQEHKAGPLAGGAIPSCALMPIISDELSKMDPQHQELFRDILAKSAAKSILQGHIKDEASAALFMLPAQVNLHNGPKQSGMVSNVKPGNYVSLGVSLLHPLSRGSSHISSADPSAPPVIDPRYLSHPLDIEVFARHLMALEVLAKSSPLDAYLKPDGQRAQGLGGRNADANTLERAKDYIKETTLTNNHPVGTCAMLPLEKGDVVDARLCVYGVANLRVVDSSIMPLIPRGHIVTSVYTVAEKAADLIKEDYGL
ncbi:hypothetical protein G7054_g14359 [Neopestalotiopsis clavispora]|nr:hypothetical protein G7054_g14359 [Neopestalotiopsis clavispora]